MNRRQFLKRSLAAAAVTTAPAPLLALADPAPVLNPKYVGIDYGSGGCVAAYSVVTIDKEMMFYRGHHILGWDGTKWKVWSRG